MKPKILFYFLLINLIFGACNPTKRVPEGKYLLIGNKIETKKKNILSNKSRLLKEELPTIIKQKPNKKIIYIIRPYLTFYNWGSVPKDDKWYNGWFKRWMRNIGEEPILLDSLLIKKSDQQMEVFLAKKGFFGSTVVDSVSIVGTKKAIVYYKVNDKEPYKINKIFFKAMDPNIDNLVKSDSINYLIKSGQIYDEEILVKERERIANQLKNQGYFLFEPQYITYKIDTNLNSQKLNIYINVNNPKEPSSEKPDSLIYTNHPTYKIGKIYTLLEFNPRSQSNIYNDTILVNGIYYLYNKKLNYKPNVLSQRTFLKTENTFRKIDMDETYSKLIDMKMFRLVDIENVTKTINGSNYIDSYIKLKSLTKNSFLIEAESTNRSGIFGIGGSFSYNIKNPFKRAEILSFKIRAAMEAASNISSLTLAEQRALNNVFNTLEIGPEINLEIPKFLLPIKPERFSKYFAPKTNISIAYNFQRIPDLDRHVINTQFAYSWNESKTKTHRLTPFEINFVKVNAKQDLINFLNNLRNAFLINTYIDHLSIGSKYTFLYNNQNLQKRKNFFFFRGSFETYGNLLRLMGSNLNWQQNENGGYQLFDITFSQFIKTDFDFRYYKKLSEKHNTVSRISIGVGKPLENLGVLPIEKVYFGGGSNSIRAWAARSLGPGTYFDTTNTLVFRYGEIDLQGNLEYRFNVISFIKGALFADAGNVWTLDESIYGEASKFQFDRFYKQIALGAGAGLRFDFSFFIFRLDLGIKMRDPSISDDNGWVVNHIFDRNWKNDFELKYQRKYPFANLNFGIGYPF